MRVLAQVVAGCGAVLTACSALAEESITHEQAVAAMHRAVTFFRENCSSEGGYVFRVSADLEKREGEGRVGSTSAWIQPPGTPAVGMAYLEAYRLTGDPLLKEAAIETARALMRGQLCSGGWTESIEFDRTDRERYAYRIEVPPHAIGRRRNITTFDDDKSQSCARFLMQLDATLDFKDTELHEATLFALDAFLKAQYPNGAWPQRYSEFPNADEFPVQPARFPENWSRTYPGKNYAGYYTLNDGTISDLIATMLDAYDVYDDERYLDSARKGGDFFLLAQLPEPQPGWAQQYNREMEPAWARKFEPPAITGGESQGVMRTLITLYRRTADRKYLEPLPGALAYYKKLALPGHQLARFYEIGTDRPLYFTRNYELTYSDDDMPTHYAFKVSGRIDRIEEEYDRVRALPVDRLWKRQQAWKPGDISRPRLSDSEIRQAARVARTLDKRGAWVEEGRMRTHGSDDETREVIESRTFARNLLVLARFIAATSPE